MLTVNGVPFVSQLFLIDDNATSISQTAPYPKISIRYMTGTPSNVVTGVTMTTDAVGKFYYPWTPTNAGQYQISFEYQVDGVSRFYFDEVDAEDIAGDVYNIYSDHLNGKIDGDDSLSSNVDDGSEIVSPLPTDVELVGIEECSNV
jgi:hypothetical protein